MQAGQGYPPSESIPVSSPCLALTCQKSREHTHAVLLTKTPDIPSRFNTSHAGLPGNDDSGAMASFTLFSMLGLFPNPGQNVYFITPPFFEAVSIVNQLTNATATIRNVNFDKDFKKIYIQSARLNGEEYTRNWIGHEFFTEGWMLELVLGDAESEWGTRVEDRPPSMSTMLMDG